MRRLSLARGLCALTAIGGAAQGAAMRSGIPKPAVIVVEAGRVERLEQWIKAAARHTPGQEDHALAEIAGWPNGDLKALWIDANALIQIMRLPPDRRPTRFNIRGENQKIPAQVYYSPMQFKRMIALSCAAAGMLDEVACIAIRAADELDADLRQVGALAHAARQRGDNNYLIRHGAILHSDVAMLAPAAMIAPGPVAAAPAGLERFRMDISDGQELDLHQSAVHWELARMLLDFVQPAGRDRADPAHDDMVRQWYRATAAWMQLKEDHDKVHLEHARTLFPSDPDILFLSACQRETYAGAPIQTAVRSALLPTGMHLDVGSDRAELRDAEVLFRRALEVKPDFAEARLRDGRVLDLLARHADAAVELRKAIGGLTDRQMLYYGSMFLGAAEEVLGNRDAARASYEQSAALYPMAQSPLLALSQLARRSGDRRGALAAIDRLFALPREQRNEQDDPWWWYYVSQGRDAEALIDAMQRPYRLEVLQ